MLLLKIYSSIFIFKLEPSSTACILLSLLLASVLLLLLLLHVFPGNYIILATVYIILAFCTKRKKCKVSMNVVFANNISV